MRSLGVLIHALRASCMSGLWGMISDSKPCILKYSTSCVDSYTAWMVCSSAVVFCLIYPLVKWSRLSELWGVGLGSRMDRLPGRETFLSTCTGCPYFSSLWHPLLSKLYHLCHIWILLFLGTGSSNSPKTSVSGVCANLKISQSWFSFPALPYYGCCSIM